MESMRLKPVERIDGEIFLPGSKSLSNRALLLAALAEGRTEITNLLDSDDVRRMLDALNRLGVPLELSQDRMRCVVIGAGGGLSPQLTPWKFTSAMPARLSGRFARCSAWAGVSFP